MRKWHRRRFKHGGSTERVTNRRVVIDTHDRLNWFADMDCSPKIAVHGFAVMSTWCSASPSPLDLSNHVNSSIATTTNRTTWHHRQQRQAPPPQQQATGRLAGFELDQLQLQGLMNVHQSQLLTTDWMRHVTKGTSIILLNAQLCICIVSNYTIGYQRNKTWNTILN